MIFDDRELKALAVDLGNVEPGVRKRLRGVLQEGSSDLKKAWQANAKESSGAHGALYPYSIDWEQVAGTRTATGQFSSNLDFEIGPDESKVVGGRNGGSGGMVGKAGAGYEFGSVNQPPHLDGQRAADEIVPRIVRRIDITASDLFDA